MLLVTQSHELHVCYLRTYIPSLKVLSCSLSQPYFFTEGQARFAIHDVPSGPKASRLCIKATIGLFYNGMSLLGTSILLDSAYLDTLLLVAMGSQRYPSSESLKPAAHNDIDIGLPLDLPQDPIPEEHLPPLDWGALTEELTIELCEVNLRFDGSAMSMSSVAVQSSYPDRSQQALRAIHYLLFIIPRPISPTLHLPALRLQSLILIILQELPRRRINNRVVLYQSLQRHSLSPPSLTATTVGCILVDICHCSDLCSPSADSSVPKSEMVAYSITRFAPSPTAKITWVLSGLLLAMHVN